MEYGEFNKTKIGLFNTELLRETHENSTFIDTINSILIIRYYNIYYLVLTIID